MFKNIYNVLRTGLIVTIISGAILLGMEIYFVVTNSSRPDFWPDDIDAPDQNMSSGLFSGYVHEDNPDHEKIKAKGGTLCDFDLDGDLDLYYGYVNSYYFENQGNIFKDKTETYNIDQSGCRGLIVGDMDNNGYPDIIKWRFMSQAQPQVDCNEYNSESDCINNSDCYWEGDNCWNAFGPEMLPHNILMNQGNHAFITKHFLASTELNFLHSLGTIDADLDGDLDIIAIQEEDDEQFVLYINEGEDASGNLNFVKNYSFYRPYGDISSSRILAISDYDNDGDQDVYIGRKYGYNWFFENQTLVGPSGDVTYNADLEEIFVEKAVELGISDESVNEVGSMGYGAAWGDYDNDQDFDLYLTNWGVNRLFENKNQNFINIAEIQNLESDELSNGASWGDYNNDGLLDLWASSIRNFDDLYINLGNGTWDTTASPNFLSATQDVISADINNDGWLDVFAPGLEMQNGPPGAKYTSLLYNNISQDSSFSNNNWLKIKLEGQHYGISNNGWSENSNISAIGARVVLHLSDMDIMREVIGGKGHGNMEPLQLHFGLNTNMIAQGLTIYWPSRDANTRQRKTTYIDGPIDANLSYTIVENIGFVGIKGDINNDEVVNIQDIIILLNYVLSDTSPSEDSMFWSVDMNYDNTLNVLDVVRLVNNILN